MKPAYDVLTLKRLRAQPGYVHPRFGSLNRPDAVIMPRCRLLPDGYVPEDFHFIHLSVTGRCNARCAGCINAMSHEGGSIAGAGRTALIDTLPERDARAVLSLLNKTNGHTGTVLCLYGGEPLLVTDKMERIYRLLSAAEGGRDLRFMLYTNGQLLGRALDSHRQFLSKIWLYSLSIDGRKEQHDLMRPGTNLAVIHENLRKLKEVRTGQALMWSTLREGQSLADCFEEFQELRKERLVEHFFWHWVETDAPFGDFSAYLSHYEKDLRQIMDAYVEALSRNELLSLVHINELILYLLQGEQRKGTGCGVEVDRNFDILDGRIYPCADLPLSEAVGSISEDGTPHVSEYDLSHYVSYKEALGCVGCGVHDYCGGRCPVQGMTSGAERLIEYCQLMRVHVGTVLEYMDDVCTLMQKHSISLQQIYDRSAFYCQFTDVTP
jgi:uncharacterized protein